MREIKFRMWDKETGQMYPEWQLHPEFGVLLSDERFVVMQYTGLKDKNGKEIYEGDIAECELCCYGFPTKTENLVVKYGRFLRDKYVIGGAGFYPFYDKINAYEIVGVEVIGNVYEGAK